MTNIDQHERMVRTKAAHLMGQVQSLGFLLKASVVRRQFRCGKPGCRCARGHLHRDMIVTRKDGGRTQTIRVRQGRETEALVWFANWRRLKLILSQLTAVEMQILRMPLPGIKAHTPAGPRGKPGKTRKVMPQANSPAAENARRV